MTGRGIIKATTIVFDGKKKLIFKENIFVEPFELQDEGLITGRIEINGSVSKIPLQYALVEDYYVCYNV